MKFNNDTISRLLPPALHLYVQALQDLADDTKFQLQWHSLAITDSSPPGLSLQVVNLEEGYDYLVVALGDCHSQELHLTVYDMHHQQVAQDSDFNPLPLLVLTPPQSASYTLQVTMTACNQAPCFYGLGLLARLRRRAPAQIPLNDKWCKEQLDNIIVKKQSSSSSQSPSDGR